MGNTLASMFGNTNPINNSGNGSEKGTGTTNEQKETSKNSESSHSKNYPANLGKTITSTNDIIPVKYVRRDNNNNFYVLYNKDNNNEKIYVNFVKGEYKLPTNTNLVRPIKLIQPNNGNSGGAVKKTRKAPKEFAKNCKVGTIKKGKDGSDWKVYKRKNGIKSWKRV